MKEKFVKIGIAVCIIIVVLSMILLISEVISCRKKLQIQKLSADRFCYPEQYPRPELYDRSGGRLLGNRRNDCLPSGRWRYAAIDGKFAAGLLGFTQVTAGREIGKSGIERMIDRKNIPGAPVVYLALDSKIQRNAEDWLDTLCKENKFNHMYITCLNSRGELVGAGQRPVLDINNRKTVDGGMSFFQAVMVFPVPRAFCSMLTGKNHIHSSDLDYFDFTQKTGLFPVEAKGHIMTSCTTPADGSPVLATSFRFLTAYIGAVEKKPAPPLQLFSDGKQPLFGQNAKVQWLSVLPSDGKTIAALGKISAADNNHIYILINIECDKKTERAEMTKVINLIKTLQFDAQKTAVKKYPVQIKINETVQNILNQEVKSACEKYQASAVYAAVANTANGQIIALTQYGKSASPAAEFRTEPFHTLYPIFAGKAIDCGMIHPNGEADISAPEEEFVFKTMQEFGIYEAIQRKYSSPQALRRIVSGTSNWLSLPRLLQIYCSLANGKHPDGTPVFKQENTHKKVIDMLISMTGPNGTARSAAIPGYKVAAKTGCGRNYLPGKGYSLKKYTALIAGFVPADSPEFAMVIIFDPPKTPITTGVIEVSEVFRTPAEKIINCQKIKKGEGK